MPKFVTVVISKGLWSWARKGYLCRIISIPLELYVAGPCVLINLEKLFSGSKVRIVKEMSN